MSEQSIVSNHEQQDRPVSPELKRLPDPEHAERLREGEIDPETTLERLNEAHEAIAEAIQEKGQSNPLEQLQAAEKTEETPAGPSTINQELKVITLRRELQQLRRKLPLPQRTLSQIIHVPAVRVASEATGKTLTRPSGLLGGGIVAFLGSSTYLYLAKHVGFTYNYAVFLLLFVAGFLVGLILETLVWAYASARHRES